MERDILIDLRERLVAAEKRIKELTSEYRSTHNEPRPARLTGKAEGVRLALSYVDEILRASDAPTPPEPDADHDFLPVAGHPDDDECTHRSDGTDATYCGQSRSWHEHHPRCYQNTGVPADLPADICDCRVLRMIEQAAEPDADERDDYIDLAERWDSASATVRAFEHHWPADCLAEAAEFARALSRTPDANLAAEVRDLRERIAAHCEERDDALEALADATAERDRYLDMLSACSQGVEGHVCCDCPDAHLAAAKAEALEEAADNMPLRRSGQPYEHAAGWLRARAARLREQGGE